MMPRRYRWSHRRRFSREKFIFVFGIFFGDDCDYPYCSGNCFPRCNTTTSDCRTLCFSVRISTRMRRLLWFYWLRCGCCCFAGCFCCCWSALVGWYSAPSLSCRSMVAVAVSRWLLCYYYHYLLIFFFSVGWPIFSRWLGEIEGVKFDVAAPNETIDRTRSTDQNKQKKERWNEEMVEQLSQVNEYYYMSPHDESLCQVCFLSHEFLSHDMVHNHPEIRWNIVWMMCSLSFRWTRSTILDGWDDEYLYKNSIDAAFDVAAVSYPEIEEVHWIENKQVCRRLWVSCVWRES